MSSVYITDVTAGTPPKKLVDCAPWCRQATAVTGLKKGSVYHITAATFAPGQQGAFWLAVAGHGLTLEPLPLKHQTLRPKDRAAAEQKMQANYDPYPSCASCHNDIGVCVCVSVCVSVCLCVVCV